MLQDQNKDFFTEEEERERVEQEKEKGEGTDSVEDAPVVVEHIEKVIEETPDTTKEFQTEVLSKMELLLEKMQEFSVRLTVLENPVVVTLASTEEVTETIDKDKEIDDTTNEVLGDLKMDELIEEFKKAFPSQEPSLEAVKGLFEEMNNDIKGMFTVQS
jgi:hypothetical protein